jgi:hypothetical protein
MTEKPILFSGPMVKAILDGRKTMTRRVLKPQPIWSDGGSINDGGGQMDYIEPHWAREPKLAYAPGDLLWVRETWAEACELDENDKPATDMRTYYRADGEPFSRYLDPDTDEWREGIKWRPSIFMPRWASRISLRVTAVKVERLQDISEDDAKAEGIFQTKAGSWSAVEDYSPLAGTSPVGGFYCLWTAINGEGAWDANPWVMAVSFERVKP